jgi:flagellar assembly protein FliH
MSSKLFPPDHALQVSPVAWRMVDSGQPATPYLPEIAGVLPYGGMEREGQLEQRLHEAHAAGVREGEAAGKGRAAAEFQPVIERLARSIEETAGLRARLRREAEADLVRLALAIARRILRRELSIDPDALHGLVLAALDKLQSQEICRVRVHPAQASLVSACLQQVRSASPVEVIADPSSEPGAVIFETDRGSLDASLESQLKEIERGLADRLRNPR